MGLDYSFKYKMIFPISFIVLGLIIWLVMSINFLVSEKNFVNYKEYGPVTLVNARVDKNYYDLNLGADVVIGDSNAGKYAVSFEDGKAPSIPSSGRILIYTRGKNDNSAIASRKAYLADKKYWASNLEAQRKSLEKAKIFLIGTASLALLSTFVICYQEII